MIPSTMVQKMITDFGISTRELLCGLTHVAKAHAVIPISNFQVGSAALTDKGNIYLGVNAEFVGLGLGFCKYLQKPF